MCVQCALSVVGIAFKYVNKTNMKTIKAVAVL